ncbi:MAG TPA: carboxypeptidase regulatory-like domain-containing protein [Vicinamibacterales bacterium]|nr:carboxypeptidase regulatory-like domain-containing protein [Vicinamibacterales bacterium]
MRGSVRGSVVRADSEDPIADMMVSGRRSGVSSPASPRATISVSSDRSGAFAFDNLIEGEWVFMTQGSRGEVLGKATVHVFDDALSDVTIAVHGVRSDQSANRADRDPGRDVEPSRPSKLPTLVPGSVSGHVVRDFNGQAVPGATVSVVSGEGREPDVLPVTDAEGSFFLDGLHEGEWLLRALGPAGETGTATVHVFDNALSEVTIEVTGAPRTPRRGGGTRSANRSERGMRGNLRGRVVRRDDGNPIRDATITIVTGPGPAPDIAPVSNDSGMFSLDALPAGEWVLRAIAPGGRSGEAVVHVTAGAVANVVIYVPAGSE